MSNQLWPQKASALLDIPTNEHGALDGEAGQVLVINPAGDGLAFAPAGTGGTAGPPGPANSLTIGTVGTGAADAVITGSSPTQVLNLTLPAGPKGDTGAAGVAGAQGQQGVQGVAGPKGDTGAAGPKGDQGIQGPTGPQGAGLVPDDYGNLTDAFVASTETAAVTIVYLVNPLGDLRANLNIPAGIAGDQAGKIIGYTVANGWQSYGQFTGVQGPVGPQGAQGIQGPIGDTGPKGDKGDQGVQGIAGAAGTQGIQGPQGPKGDQGDPGINGTTPDVSDKLTKSGDKTTGVLVFGKATRETVTAIPAAAIDASLGNYFTKTITGAISFTVAGISVVAGEVSSFILELTNGGVGVVTWWAGITWAGGLPPVLTAAGVDTVGFYTLDKGVTWRGLLLAGDIK